MPGYPGCWHRSLLTDFPPPSNVRLLRWDGPVAYGWDNPREAGMRMLRRIREGHTAPDVEVGTKASRIFTKVAVNSTGVAQAEPCQPGDDLGGSGKNCPFRYVLQ